MLEFGFTDALNRCKLEVPIPGDPEPKSRLCNIFTDRVLRKLGIETEKGKQREGLKEIIEKAKDWVLKNKDAEGLIDVFKLTEFLSTLTAQPAEIIALLKNGGYLFDVGRIDKFGVKQMGGKK
jgi:hypothetical protein